MNAKTFAQSLIKRVADALESGHESSLDEDLQQMVEEFTHVGDDPDTIHFTKFDEDQRMAWGWALVSVEKGVEVEDRQGDVVDTGELQQAVHGSFMENGRVLKRMHSGKRVGEVVDSIVFTKDVQKALGIDLGREGWFVGVRVDDPATWIEVKKGKLPAFSIGGAGERHAMDQLHKSRLEEDEVEKAWSDAARAAAAEARKHSAHATQASIHANRTGAIGDHQDAAAKIRAASALHAQNGNMKEVKNHDKAALYHEHEANRLSYKTNGPRSTAHAGLTAHAQAVHEHLVANGGHAEHGDIHAALGGHLSAPKISAGLKELKVKGLAHGSTMTGSGSTYHTTHLLSKSEPMLFKRLFHALTLNKAVQRSTTPLMFEDVLKSDKGAQSHDPRTGRYTSSGGSAPSENDLADKARAARSKEHEAHLKHIEAQRTGKNKGVHAANLKRATAQREAAEAAHEAHLNTRGQSMYSDSKGTAAYGAKPAAESDGKWTWAKDTPNGPFSSGMRPDTGAGERLAPGAVIDTNKYPLAAKGQFVAVDGRSNSKGQVAYHNPDGTVMVRLPNGGVVTALPQELIPAKMGATTGTPQIVGGEARTFGTKQPDWKGYSDKTIAESKALRMEGAKGYSVERHQELAARHDTLAQRYASRDPGLSRDHAGYAAGHRRAIQSGPTASPSVTRQSMTALGRNVQESRARNGPSSRAYPVQQVAHASTTRASQEYTSEAHRSAAAAHSRAYTASFNTGERAAEKYHKSAEAAHRASAEANRATAGSPTYSSAHRAAFQAHEQAADLTHSQEARNSHKVLSRGHLEASHQSRKALTNFAKSKPPLMFHDLMSNQD